VDVTMYVPAMTISSLVSVTDLCQLHHFVYGHSYCMAVYNVT